MGLILRSATPEDKDSILSLLNASFINQQRSTLQRDTNYWNWKFLNSPFGKSILSVAESGGRIVAVDHLWPWEFNIRGEIFKAMQPCDSAVHPSARGEGLFKSLRFHNIESLEPARPSFLFNFPNDQSFPALMSLGWNYLGKISWWVKVLNPISFLKGSYIRSKSMPFKTGGNYPLDTNVLYHLSNNSRNFDRYVKINRIPGFYEYRYVGHPSREYGMVYNEKGVLSNAAIFTTNQRGPIRELIIVDIIGSHRYTIPLIKQVLKVAVNQRIDMVAVAANMQYLRSDLWQLGFVKHKEKRMVVLPLDARLEHIAHSFDTWSFMAGMHDSI